MADPVSALATAGAVSSVLQIVDFSAKVLYHSAILMASESKALRENNETERLARSQVTYAQDLRDSMLRRKRDLPSQARALCDRADEISKDAGELLQMLADLKVTEHKKSVKKVYQSARQATRALSKRSIIKSKQEQLHELTSQLGIVMLQHISETQDDMQQSLKVQIEEVVQKITASTSTYSVDEATMNPSQDTQHDPIQFALLKTLKFDEIEYRQQDIPRAYGDTYDWAFFDRGCGSLSSWLATESGIFWVRGLPGAGKSVFMKHIVFHPETQRLLNLWAHPQQYCLISSFFFWYLGSTMQRSVKGLLRSILYALLTKFPTLIEVACPDRCGAISAQNGWSEDELYASLNRIARSYRSSAEGTIKDHPAGDVRCCIFIDGLDECDGDYRKLLSALEDLSSSERIKICVSSRPWNVFTNAFGDSAWVLRLEMWTTNDIEHYVRDKLTQAEERQKRRRAFKRRTPQAERLIKSVVDKANGVFFWVYLVVGSLLDGFEEGDSVAIMQRRLDMLPGELVSYFRLMLQRMDPVYRSTTATCLFLASLTIRDPYKGLQYVSYLDIWPMGETPDFFENPDFAFQDEWTFCPSDDLRIMKEEADLFIGAGCRDFLHVSDAGDSPYDQDSDIPYLTETRVQVLHRTVHDFLMLPDIQETLEKHIPEHLQDDTMPSCVLLARAKIAPIGHPGDICRYIDDLFSAICISEATTTRIIQELDELEAFYVDEHCTSDCPIHVRIPNIHTLRRHRRLLQHRCSRTAVATFSRRQKAHKNTSTSTSGFGSITEADMIRFSFGLKTIHVEGSWDNHRALSLDEIISADYRGFIKAGARACDIIRGCKGVSTIVSTRQATTEMFLRHWLLSITSTEQDAELWALLRFLIENGITIPQTCRTPSASARKSMSCMLTTFELDAGLASRETELVTLEKALEFVVPPEQWHEIEDALYEAYTRGNLKSRRLCD